jgi:anion-transporting  ArsA/GET3 family ATPase
MAEEVFDRLERLQLIVVTGKGGVGKSTVVATLGRLLAARARRVMLIEVDPRENLHQLLDVPPSGGEVLRAAPRLYLQHLEARKVLDELVAEKLKLALLVKRVLSSPVHQHFTEGAPGLKETGVFGRALRLIQGHCPPGVRRPDVVILDAPATGHGVSWLAAPQLISEVIRSGPIGHMATEIAAFMTEPDRFGVVVTTIAEEMPVQECLELLQTLDERLRRRPELVVVNALYPALPEKLDDDPTTVLWRRRRAVNDRELARLRESWDGPTVELPLLPLDPGPPLVEELARSLRRSASSA